MALTTAQTAAIKAKLILGKTPKELSEGEFKDVCNYVTILRLRKEVEKDREQSLAQQLTTITPELLHTVVEKIKEEEEVRSMPVLKALDDIVDGANSLQLLNLDFHKAMTLALKKANVFLSDENLEISDLILLTNTISSAYNNVFNNKGVNVNINNGQQFSDSKLSMFKGSMRE